MIAPASEIAQSYLEKNFDYHYVSITGKWATWVWRNVALLRLTGAFTTEEADQLMKDCWSILMERKTAHAFLVAVVDITRFEVQTEEFRSYMKGWDHLLDREDLQIVFITGTEMKAVIWHAIFVMIGKWDRVRFFGSQKQAFAWLSRRLQVEVGA